MLERIFEYSSSFPPELISTERVCKTKCFDTRYRVYTSFDEPSYLFVTSLGKTIHDSFTLTWKLFVLLDTLDTKIFVLVCLMFIVLCDLRLFGVYEIFFVASGSQTESNAALACLQTYSLSIDLGIGLLLTDSIGTGTTNIERIAVKLWIFTTFIPTSTDQ